MGHQPPGGEKYRLKYRDAEGTPSDRYIEIISIMRGNAPSNSYIYAYCHSVYGFRQFRFDRIKAIYTGAGEKIKDPFSYLLGKHREYEPSDNPEYNADALANEVLRDTRESKPETTKQPENEKINVSEIKDIPKLKKMRKGFYITSVVLALLGFISIPTIILPVLFFSGMGFFLAAAWGIRNQIKEVEAEQATLQS